MQPTSSPFEPAAPLRCVPSWRQMANLRAIVAAAIACGCHEAPGNGPEDGGNADGGGGGDGGGGVDGGTVPSSRFSTTATTWRVPSPSEVPASDSAQVFAVADSYYSLFDLNGDDRPDLVFTSVRQSNGSITGTTPGAGTPAPHWNVHMNTGTGLSPTAQVWPVRSQPYHPATSFRDITHWATVDIDGDDKVDFLETSDPDVGGDPQPWGAITPTPVLERVPGDPLSHLDTQNRTPNVSFARNSKEIRCSGSPSGNPPPATRRAESRSS